MTSTGQRMSTHVTYIQNAANVAQIMHSTNRTNSEILPHHFTWWTTEKLHYNNLCKCAECWGGPDAWDSARNIWNVCHAMAVLPAQCMAIETDRAQLSTCTRCSINHRSRLSITFIIIRLSPWSRESWSHQPSLNDSPAAAVTLSRSHQCRAQCRLNHRLLAATSCCQHLLLRTTIQSGRKSIVINQQMTRLLVSAVIQK